jgi:hypothetical protein
MNDRLLQEGARRVLLSDRDAEVFFDAIDNPREACPKLAQLLAAHLDSRIETGQDTSLVTWTPRPGRLTR